MSVVLFLSAPASADSVKNLVSQIEATYQKTEGWQARFKQQTYVELLERRLHKNGNITLKRPNRLRIEYQGGSQKQYISNGKKLWIYSPQDKQVEVYNKLERLVSKEALNFLNGLAKLSEQFDVNQSVKASEAMIVNKKLALLTLLPKKPNSNFTQIVLAVNRQDYQVYEMTLFNVSGNKTHYAFSKIALNDQNDDSFFEFKAPKGVRKVRGY